MTATSSLSAAALRAPFDAITEPTLGVEEEVMLLDPHTLDLVPRAAQVLERLAGAAHFKLELPASQLEIALGPCAHPREAVERLSELRAELAHAGAGLALPAAAGAHPFAAAEGELNAGPRYDALERRYGTLLRRQLVCALQLHVAIPGTTRALAVYNALRERLPLLAALAANAPFHEGRDTGLASVRPLVCQALPRQGVPPALESFDALAAELRWGATAGALDDARSWWWELRPNLRFGTLEVRVPDAQSTVSAAGGVIALVHCLAAQLAARHDAGELPPPAPTWRIAENRALAMRAGLLAELAGARSGRARPAHEWLAELLEELSPVARALDCAAELELARELARAPGYQRQRELAAEAGMQGLARGLCDAFSERPALGLRDRASG